MEEYDTLDKIIGSHSLSLELHNLQVSCHRGYAGYQKVRIAFLVPQYFKKNTQISMDGKNFATNLRSSR